MLQFFLARCPESQKPAGRLVTSLLYLRIPTRGAGVRQFGERDALNGIALTKNLTKGEGIRRYEKGQEAMRTTK
jgi:hypothetical protein